MVKSKNIFLIFGLLFSLIGCSTNENKQNYVDQNINKTNKLNIEKKEENKLISFDEDKKIEKEEKKKNKKKIITTFNSVTKEEFDKYKTFCYSLPMFLLKLITTIAILIALTYIVNGIFIGILMPIVGKATVIGENAVENFSSTGDEKGTKKNLNMDISNIAIKILEALISSLVTNFLLATK